MLSSVRWAKLGIERHSITNCYNSCGGGWHKGAQRGQWDTRGVGELRERSDVGWVGCDRSGGPGTKIKRNITTRLTGEWERRDPPFGEAK